MHFVLKAATNYLRDLCGASVTPSKQQNQIWDYREFSCFQYEFFTAKWRTESEKLCQSCFCTQSTAQEWITPGLWDYWGWREVWEQGWWQIVQLDNGLRVGTAGVSLPNNSPFLQFVIVVVDSTDRERISVTKEELYKMLAHEVSAPCVFHLYFIIYFNYLSDRHQGKQIYTLNCLVPAALSSVELPAKLLINTELQK